MDQADDRAAKRRHENLWIMTIVTAYTVCGMGNGCINPFYPKTASEKGMSSSLIGLVLCVVFIPQLVLMLINDKLIVKFGATNIFKFGTFLYGTTTIGFGFTNLLPDLTSFTFICITLKFIQGIGFSLVATTSAFIASEHIPERMSFVIGIMETGSGFGYTVGPFFGGYLYDKLSYLAPLALTGGLELLVFAMSFVTLRSIRHTSSDDADGVVGKGMLRKLMKTPAVIIPFVINAMPFAILAHYDVVLPIYGTIKLKDSTTMVGMAIAIPSLFYAGFATISGTIIDRKGKEVGFMCAGMLGVATFSALLSSLLLTEGDISLYVFGGLFIGICTFCPMAYVPVLSLLRKISRVYGVPNTPELNAFLSNVLMTALICGQLVGSGTAGMMYQHLGIPVSEFIFAGILVCLTILLLSVVMPKLRSTEHVLLISESSVNDS